MGRMKKMRRLTTGSQIQTHKYCFGVDLGGTTVKIGLLTISGEMIEKYQIPTRKEQNGKYIIGDIVDKIDAILVEKAIAKDEVAGIGMGVPGAVTDKGIVNKCINLGWGVLDIESMMQEQSGLSVKVGNDANMAALGEYWKGGAEGFSSMVFVTIGTGVGGGIIINGKPICGTNGAAAEIGHMPIVYDETEYCNCGKKGCLEQVASATGIVRIATRMLAADSNVSGLSQIENFTAKDVFEEAKKGDIIAQKVVETVSGYLGIALADAACLVDPECFIIGGGVSAAGAYFIDKIAEYYSKNAFHPSRETKIMQAKLGNDAGMYGCVKLLLNNLQEENK